MVEMIKNDMMQGTKRNIWKFVLAFVFSFFCCFLLNRIVVERVNSGMLREQSPGFQDSILYILGGMVKYVESDKIRFEIPINWTAVQLLVTSCIFLYPIKDLYERGNYMLILSGSKKRWWISKCIWSQIQVIILYGCIWCGAIFAALILREDFSGLSNDILNVVMNVSFYQSSGMIIYIMIMPIVHSLMAAIVQINISLVTGPVLSIAIVLTYQVLSAYSQRIYLLGNYSMILRSDTFVRGGLCLSTGILIELIVMFASVLGGLIYIQKKDVISKNH